MIKVSDKIRIDVDYRYLYNIKLYRDPHRTQLEYYSQKFYLNEKVCIKYPIILIYYNDEHFFWDSTRIYDVNIIKDILKRNLSSSESKEFLNNDTLMIKFDLDVIPLKNVL